MIRCFEPQGQQATGTELIVLAMFRGNRNISGILLLGKKLTKQ